MHQPISTLPSTSSTSSTSSMRRASGRLASSSSRCSDSTLITSSRTTHPRRLHHRRAHTIASAAPEGSDRWWDELKRGSIQGPPSPDGSSIRDSLHASGDLESDSLAETLLGSKGYQQMADADRAEAQRVWDAMRGSAWRRYQAGLMPEWFDPEWIMQEEAPENRMLRLEREGPAEMVAPETASGGGDNGEGGGGKGNGGWPRLWREEDPYWPLRNWGDHPMRWWTFAFAAALAAGGIFAHAAHGPRAAESLWTGGAAAAALSMCAMAMSDMGDWGHGPLAVKAAWLACAGLAAKEWCFGWAHRPVPSDGAVQWGGQRGGSADGGGWRLGGCGLASVAMCAFYMWTGMAELDEWALPANPGSVYKNPDVAYKHKVWKQWGYGNASIRT